MGIRIDYLSPILYLVDLLWIGLFIIESFKKENFESKNRFRIKSWLIGFLIVNVLAATNKWVAIYGWFRVLQLVWTVWFIKNNRELVKDCLKYVIPIWIIIESLLAIGQISKGGSLGGLWWWFGERSFDFNTIGIAQMSIKGSGLVRAYGTFSHPNSLAGFLLVSWIWWWKNKNNKIFWWIVFWLGLIGIVMTGSRTVWLLTGFSLIYFLKEFFSENKKGIKIVALLVLVLMVSIKIIDFNYPINNFLGGWDENGLIKRGQLNLASLGMIKKSPIFGVGMKNFLVNLPDFQNESHFFWLQPVHNILLLILSEVGFLGLGILIFGIKKLFKNKNMTRETWLIIGVVLISGMVDHYWLTLPQNMWLMTIILGLI